MTGDFLLAKIICGEKMSNKQFLILSLMFFIPFLLICQDNISKYDGLENYSLSLPKGWEQIYLRAKYPDNEELTKKLNQLATQYTAAFQRKSDRQYFDYPYLLVQIHKSTGSLDQIKKSFMKEKENISVKTGNLSLKFVLDPVINKEKNCIIINPDAGLPEVPNLRVFIVIFPGKYDMVQLNFYSDQFSRDEADFNFILNNFGFSYGFGYIEENQTNKLIGKIITAIIAAFLLAYFAKKKKKDPYMPINNDKSRDDLSKD